MADITEEQKTVVDKIVAKVKKAQAEFATFSQEQVDKIFKAASVAAYPS